MERRSKFAASSTAAFALVAALVACSGGATTGPIVVASPAAATPSPSLATATSSPSIATATPSPLPATAPPSSVPVTAPSVCAAVEAAPPVLYVPAPGATGVPTDEGRLIVGTPSDGTFQLQAGDGAFMTVGPVSAAPSPLPSGAQGAGTAYAVAIPALAAGATYTVRYVGNDPDPTCPHESSGVIGTFTTQ